MLRAAPPAPGSAEGRGLRLSPIRSRGEGRLARCPLPVGRAGTATPLGMEFGHRAHFDQTPERPS
eukprot:3925041-Alexandrium_andersonii.AAC.1